MGETARWSTTYDEQDGAEGIEGDLEGLVGT